MYVGNLNETVKESDLGKLFDLRTTNQIHLMNDDEQFLWYD